VNDGVGQIYLGRAKLKFGFQNEIGIKIRPKNPLVYTNPNLLERRFVSTLSRFLACSIKEPIPLII
jgi:hypothetical protein